MARGLGAIALAVALIGCGQADKYASAPAGVASEEAAMAPVEAPAPMATRAQVSNADMADAPATGGEQQAPSQPAGPAPVLYLAYSYGVTLEVPAAKLQGVLDAHVQACQAAGPRLCQLIGSNISGDPQSSMNGYVSLRGEPGWLRSFRAGLAHDADSAGGRVMAETTNTEDLTRAIVDTEARLRAQTALRDRLQRLLESRPGRLSDLLEVERELARVQGEIDAVQSNLAVMRTRVSMSELSLNYQSQAQPVGSDTFRPLGLAFANFLGIVISGFAAIVTIIAGLLPFVIVFVPIVWGLMRWRRARGGRFFGRKKAEKAAEE